MFLKEKKCKDIDKSGGRIGDMREVLNVDSPSSETGSAG
jgi:hypothetical protein